MKKIVFLVLAALTAVLMSGCSKKTEPTPVFISEPLQEGNISEAASDIRMYGKVKSGNELALTLRKVAEKLKSEGYSYFIVKGEYPSFLTTFNDLKGYCLPHVVDDISTIGKKTSLELDKCKFQKSFFFIPLTQPSMFQPTWSVEQVLNDKVIDRNIEKALLDGEYQGKQVGTMSDKKLWWKLIYKH